VQNYPEGWLLLFCSNRITTYWCRNNRKNISWNRKGHGISCRNICIKYKAKKSYRSSYYEDGLRRCTECEVFIRWNNNSRCPCCGTTLRIKTHDAKVRRKLRGTKKFVYWATDTRQEYRIRCIPKRRMFRFTRFFI